MMFDLKKSLRENVAAFLCGVGFESCNGFTRLNCVIMYGKS